MRFNCNFDSSRSSAYGAKGGAGRGGWDEEDEG